MKILKFGGSSVESPDRINQVKDIILNAKKENNKIAVVVSAFGGVTDQLIELGQNAKMAKIEYKKLLEKLEKRHLETVEKLVNSKSKSQIRNNIKNEFKELNELLQGVFLLKELSPRSLDNIASFGERLSAYIISEVLNQYCPSEFLDARKLLKTDDNFINAKVNFKETNKNIKEYFDKHKKLQIITGFIGSNDQEETTTIGRGGSDYTASIFGAALNVEEIQIWTDVNGIMTADPRKAKKAFSLEGVSYKEAMEMSHFGAKVIFPPTMQPALKKEIPIRVKNTMQPDFEGSLISKNPSPVSSAIKGISSISDIALVQLQGSGLVGVPGIAQRLFTALATKNINIILISQASSEHSICFAIKPEQYEKAKKAIEQEFKREMYEKMVDKVQIEKDLSIIAIVGENMKKVPGTSGKIFQSLGNNGINIKAIAQGSSELNISIVISNKEEKKAINVIHDALFLSKTKTLNLFMIGPGLVGRTLLNQIQKQAKTLLNNQSLEINLIALADSKKMLFEEDGIKLSNWKKAFSKTKDKSNIENFIKKMIDLNLANSIFVDCSSSDKVASQYKHILNSNISIVTPNKKAQSSDIKNYLNLAQASAKSNAKFLYETNVGAGLPIIKTLHDLQLSGDKINKIEAVLSGTLSYIFNNYDGKKSFSEVVKTAQEKGYTEPDPRDDLNGLDVARKILILARECGHLLELEDIKVQNLVPEDCRSTKSVEEFFEKLQTHDKNFKNLLEPGKKLRYIAKLEDNKLSVSLQAVDESHPFYNLSGSDNIVTYTTNFYENCPLTIKGPGAGAEVTAAGVLTDIIRIANISFNTQITKYSFLEKLKNNNLHISLIGMSNIGKSYWSDRLNKLGFKHICCDDMIEDKLKPELEKHGYKGKEDMAKWLGQPYAPQFEKNEKKYLSLENETMQEVFNKIKNKKQNIVIDTTGSLIHCDNKSIKPVKKNSLVVYIKASEEMKNDMLQKYLDCPKPVVWDNNYKQKDNQSQENALKESYKKLLEAREKLYENLADISIPFHKVAKLNKNNHFLKLIQKEL